jgi:hypothetical protein
LTKKDCTPSGKRTENTKSRKKNEGLTTWDGLILGHCRIKMHEASQPVRGMEKKVNLEGSIAERQNV